MEQPTKSHSEHVEDITRILTEGLNQSTPASDNTGPDTALGDDEGLWTVRERWVLTGGVEVTNDLVVVPDELRLGDLNVFAGHAEAVFADMRKTGGFLRIIIDSARIFISPVENVVGVYVELVTPYGDVVEHLQPGYLDREGAVDRPADEPVKED